jgi:hypothetical protein
MERRKGVVLGKDLAESVFVLGSDPPSEPDLEFLPTTCVAYGAKICLQAWHGGYLSYEGADGRITASSQRKTIHTQFTICRILDIKDQSGYLKYGDSIFLRAGSKHIIATELLRFAEKFDLQTSQYPLDSIRLQLVNISRISRHRLPDLDKFARWTILKRDRPNDSIGQQVFNTDEVLLQQDWNYVNSPHPNTPCDCCPSIANLTGSKRRGVVSDTRALQNASDRSPGSCIIWRLHLLDNNNMVSRN